MSFCRNIIIVLNVSVFEVDEYVACFGCLVRKNLQCTSRNGSVELVALAVSQTLAPLLKRCSTFVTQ